MRFLRFLLLWIVIFYCTPLFAVGYLYTNITTQGANKIIQYPGYIEGGMNYNNLTNDYGSWLGEYGVISKQTDENNTWLGTIDHRREFGAQGTIVSATNYHNFTDSWYTTESFAVSDRSFFLQHYSGALTLYHKMLESKRLVPYFGVIRYAWRTQHQDTVLNPGFIYYFEKPWVIETGLLGNRSSPGNVDTLYTYIAVTQGEGKKHYFIARYAWGHEGYLAISNNSFVQNFPSRVYTLTWRQWLGQNWGFNLIGERYVGDGVYNRTGVQLGLFRDI